MQLKSPTPRDQHKKGSRCGRAGATGASEGEGGGMRKSSVMGYAAGRVETPGESCDAGTRPTQRLEGGSPAWMGQGGKTTQPARRMLGSDRGRHPPNTARAMPFFFFFPRPVEEKKRESLSHCGA